MAKANNFECARCRMRVSARACPRCGSPTTVVPGDKDLVELAEDAAQAYTSAVKDTDR